MLVHVTTLLHTSFLPTDIAEAVAKECLVIVADIRNDAHSRAIIKVGGIKAPANATLQQNIINFMLSKVSTPY